MCSVLGLDEELVRCWMGTLEAMLKIDQEAVEKANKFDQLLKYCEDLTTG